MTAPTVEQIAEVLRAHLTLDSKRAWTPEVHAAYDDISGLSPAARLRAREAALDVYARQVAEQVAALGVGDREVGPLATRWPVGTRLRGTEDHGGGRSHTDTIRITAVTAQHVLAVNEATGHESSWTLDARPWVEVTDEGGEGA